MTRPMTQRLLAAVVLLATALALSACAAKQTEYKVLRHSSLTHPYAEPIKLYIAPDRDRSGSDYASKVSSWELDSFRERATVGLRSRRLRLDTHTAAGNPVTLELRNPYQVVGDSSEADILMTIRVDAFEEATVEVSTDRVMFWSSYGVLTHYYQGYQRVPRMLVAIDAQLRERGQPSAFYAFQARGVAVNRPTRREGFDVAMDRCETRFYERLLKR